MCTHKYFMFIVHWLSIFFDYYRGGDLGTDPDILKLVQEQTTVGLWSHGITEKLFPKIEDIFFILIWCKKLKFHNGFLARDFFQFFHETSYFFNVSKIFKDFKIFEIFQLCQDFFKKFNILSYCCELFGVTGLKAGLSENKIVSYATS